MCLMDDFLPPKKEQDKARGSNSHATAEHCPAMRVKDGGTRGSLSEARRPFGGLHMLKSPLLCSFRGGHGGDQGRLMAIFKKTERKILSAAERNPRFDERESGAEK